MRRQEQQKTLEHNSSSGEGHGGRTILIEEIETRKLPTKQQTFTPVVTTMTEPPAPGQTTTHPWTHGIQCTMEASCGHGVPKCCCCARQLAEVERRVGVKFCGRCCPYRQCVGVLGLTGQILLYHSSQSCLIHSGPLGEFSRRTGQDAPIGSRGCDVRHAKFWRHS